MADVKITALTAISANPVNPATFPIPMVDLLDNLITASGTTKKVTVNQILGSGGTATLASAAITGDLTVDTSTLKVDSANDRVGIGTASPAAGYKLDVRGILAAGNSAGTIIGGISFSTRPEIGAMSNHNLGLIANNTTMHLITPAGVFDWYDGVGGTRMTLNSTGLGVGVAPNFKIQGVGIVAATDSVYPGGTYLIGAMLNNDSANSGAIPGLDIRRLSGTGTNHGTTYIGADFNGNTYFYNGSQATNTRATSLKMTLDASGRLILLASTTTPATLATNGELTFTATSNTNLRFSYRGSDGTTRVANITLA